MALTSDPFVVVDPSFMIGGDEFQCGTATASIEPIYVETDAKTFCKPNATRRTIVGCTASLDIKISYDTTGSWNILHAMAGTVVTVVIKPADATVAATNPSITFSAQIPQVLPLGNIEIGEVSIITLDLMSDAAPVIAVAP